MKCLLVLSLMLLVPCLSVMASAQSTNATISGVIVDPAGNVIPEAVIVILNEGTGVHYSAQTNSVGIYSVTILPPGQYRVQVSKNGFKTLIKPGIILNVQSAVALNFTLPLGASSVSVTVEGGASTINTTDGSVSTVVDRKFVENIPLNGRSFQDLISMTPGVVTESPQNSAPLPGYGGDFSVNGQRTESNYYTVDGVTENSDAGTGGGSPGPASSGSVAASTSLGTSQSLISVDALQEFRVQSSTYSAEFGRSPGGQFSLVTRSGTDHLHGSAFDYLRNGYFDANDWFNDHYGVPLGALRQNDFGGTIGGPFVIPGLYNGKARLFFFASYEGLRLTLPKPAMIQYVPDTAMRQQAPAALEPILDAFPLQNALDFGSATSPSLAEFIQSYEVPSRVDSTSIRVDHNLNSMVHVFFRFGDTPSYSDSRPTFALSENNVSAQSYTFGSTIQIPSYISDEFRLGYSNSSSKISANVDGFGGGTPLGLSEALGLSQGDYSLFELIFPSIGVSQLNVASTANQGQQWNILDTVALSRGRHQIKFGFDFRDITSPLTPSPQYLIAGFFTATSVLNNSAGIATVLKRVAAIPVMKETAVFAQDEWRTASRLNLSLGLRWEVNPPAGEAHGRLPYVVLGNLSDPSSLALAPRGTPLWNTNWFSFAPRLGVAWTAHEVPGWSTVVRSGGGVFLDTDNELALQSFTGLGFQAARAFSGSAFPLTSAQLNFSPSSIAAPYTNAYMFPRRLQPPYTLQWNVAVQQELGKAQAFTATYVGAAGRRLVNLQEFYTSASNLTFNEVAFLPNNSISNYQALQLQFQRTVTHGLQALASYTWSHSIDNGSNFQALPLTRGNSDFDVRSNFVGGLSWEFPRIAEHTLFRAIVNCWGLDGRISARTAFPITLDGNFLIDPTTGSEYYGNVSLIPGKPLYLYGPQYPGGRALNGGLNASDPAVVLPASGAGNAPRNFMRGFGANQINLALRREFSLPDRLGLQFRAEAFNILNHPNFGYIDPTLTDSTFGLATQMLNQSLVTLASQYQQGGPRSMQFALKFTF